MTLEELVAKCKEAIDNPDMSMGFVVLVVPWPKHCHSGKNIRALGQRCPIMGANKDGLFVRVNPHKVLNWIKRKERELEKCQKQSI